MAGARQHPGSAVYPPSEVARRHGASSESESAEQPYAPFPQWRPGPPASFDGLPFG